MKRSGSRENTIRDLDGWPEGNRKLERGMNYKLPQYYNSEFRIPRSEFEKAPGNSWKLTRVNQ